MSQEALKWAAMTYVVAAIGAVTTLIYYVMMYLGADRD
jgi:Zn-dependent membrane protease YugP